MAITKTLKSVLAVALLATTAVATQPAAPAEAGGNAKKFVAGLVIGAAVAAIASNNHQPSYERFACGRARTCGRPRSPKVNKYGFTTERVWERPGCSKLQAQCSRGFNKACFRYEERCQIN